MTFREDGTINPIVYVLNKDQIERRSYSDKNKTMLKIFK